MLEPKRVENEMKTNLKSVCSNDFSHNFVFPFHIQSLECRNCLFEVLQRYNEELKIVPKDSRKKRRFISSHSAPMLSAFIKKIDIVIFMLLNSFVSQERQRDVTDDPHGKKTKRRV